MSHWTPGQIAAADQYLAAVPEYVEAAIGEMREALAYSDDDATTVAQLSVMMDELCALHPNLRTKVAFGYVALLYRMARGRP